jgi:hypothetical protein
MAAQRRLPVRRCSGHNHCARPHRVQGVHGPSAPAGIALVQPSARADAAANDALRLERRFKVKAGRVYELRLSSPDKARRWHLHGHWTCTGASAEIDGAADDTLVRFVLRGPDDKVIEQRNHPTSGNFSVNYDEPGTYTFLFDNSGIIRSSSREIEFEGTFDPK